MSQRMHVIYAVNMRDRRHDKRDITFTEYSLNNNGFSRDKVLKQTIVKTSQILLSVQSRQTLELPVQSNTGNNGYRRRAEKI
jgi:hypothetical protein